MIFYIVLMFYSNIMPYKMWKSPVPSKHNTMVLRLSGSVGGMILGSGGSTVVGEAGGGVVVDRAGIAWSLTSVVIAVVSKVELIVKQPVPSKMARPRCPCAPRIIYIRYSPAEGVRVPRPRTTPIICIPKLAMGLSD